MLPFGRFPRADSLLGPGDEVHRRGDGRRRRLPGRLRQGPGRRRARAARARARCSSRDRRRQAGGDAARRARFHDMGFRVLATGGTAQAIRRMGVPVERIQKLSEGSPNVVDRIEAGEVDLVINTPTGSGARADGYEIRRAAVARGHPLHHDDVRRQRGPARDPARSAAGEPTCVSLQELHGGGSAPPAPIAGGRARAAARLSRARWPRRAADRRVSAVERARRLRPDPRARPRRARRPAAGSVLHAGRGRALGRRERRAALPAARVLATRARDGGRELELPARGRSGPGTARLAELAARRGRCALVGPLGVGWRPPRADTRPLLVGGGIGAAPLLCLQDELARRAAPVLLGFRSAAHAEAAELFAGRAGAGHRRRLRRAARRSSPTCCAAELDARPARHRLRLRPAGDARGGAADCARSAGVPAQLALESGMACGFGACFGCVVPTRDGYLRALRGRSGARRAPS